MVLDAEIVDSISLTVSEKEEAGFAKEAVEALLHQINSSEAILRRDFAQLGTLLLRVRTKKYWHEWGFPTFGSYIDSIKEKVGKGRTQIYNVIGVADKLLPYVSSDQLAEMGISKAILVKQSLDQTGKAPSAEIIARAINPETSNDQLEAILFKDKNGSPETEHETYFPLGGFYCTKSEREEILRTFDIAAKTDPVISNTIPEWARKKEIIWRLCANYLSEYEALAAQGQA